MSSNRISLAFLGLLFLVIVVLSSGRISDYLKKRSGLDSQKQAVKELSIEEKTEESTFKGSETPATGPTSFILLIFGSGLATGIILRKTQK